MPRLKKKTNAQTTPPKKYKKPVRSNGNDVDANEATQDVKRQTITQKASSQQTLNKTTPPPLPKHARTEQAIEQDEYQESSQLDGLVAQLQPILKHINMHRFLWGFTAVCAFIAWNRGLMLLYALVAFLLAVLLVSYVYRFFNLSNIELERDFPKLVVAGEPFQASYDVYVARHKHFLEITDYFERQNHIISNHDINEQVINDKNNTGLTQPLFFTHIHRHSHISIKQLLPLRGVYLSNSILLSCAYPLGLLPQQKSQSVSPQKLYVLPKSFPIEKLDFSHSHETNHGNIVSQQYGIGEEITGLRQYRRGDEFKHIHWAATAKQMSQNQPWVTKQYDSQSKPAILIVINQFQCRDMAFETMLSIVSSIAHFASRHSYHCIIVGVDSLRSTSSNQSYLHAWHLDVPALDKHLNHNLIKLAKLNWLNNQATLSSITNEAEQHTDELNSDISGIKNYTDLMSYGISAHPSTNTIVTFSPFAIELPNKNQTHLSFRFGTGSKVSQSPQKSHLGHQFIYQLAPDTPLDDIAELFQDANPTYQNTIEQAQTLQNQTRQNNQQGLMT